MSWNHLMTSLAFGALGGLVAVVLYHLTRRKP